MSNLDAAHATVDALRVSGRLEPVDDGIVEAYLTVSAMVDLHPENASLWREWRALSQSLREVGHGGSDVDAALRRLSEMVNTEDDV